MLSLAAVLLCLTRCLGTFAICHQPAPTYNSLFILKILHVITRLILGGAQQNTVMSCRAQVAAGREVHLAYGPIYGPEGSLLAEARASGATLHEIPSMVRQLSPLADARCYRAVRKLVRELQPDVVHSHSSKAGIIVRAGAWRQRRNPPRLATLEHARRNGLRLRLAPPDPRDDRPQVVHTVHGLPFHDRQHPLVHRLYVGLERYAARRCHHLIAITPAMVDAFTQHHIAPAEKFTVIPSGIDVAAFAPRPDLRETIRRRYHIPLNAHVIGHVGRLDPLKGHADLMDQLPAFHEAAAARGREATLLFVGDGYHRQHLEQHPAAATGRVVYTGLVPLAEVPDHLAAMDVMALPSYQEGQSRTLCEAMLCGVPVAAYDVGGIGAVCIDGVTGRLVPVGDPVALRDAIDELLAQPDHAAQLAEAGREHVVEHFSAEAMNAAILRLYDELLTSSETSG